MRTLLLLPLPILLLLPAPAEVADPAKHPYADPAAGREGYRLAGETVNEARLYDFYQRQADHYMARPASGVPDLLPAYPGLDAGQHGHWGKHNQNNHQDGRWNEVDHGPVVAHVFRTKELTILKALCLQLEEGDDGRAVVFDTQALSYRAAWKGGFVRFEPFRWGGSRNASPATAPWFQDREERGWAGEAEGRFLGFHRHDSKVILRYRIGETSVLDLATRSGATGFQRTLEFPGGVAAPGLRLRLGSDLSAHLADDQDARIDRDDDGGRWLVLGPQAPGAIIRVLMQPDGGSRVPTAADLKPGDLTKGGPAAFPHEIAVTGELAPADRPYVVDTIPVPFKNPYQTVMQLTGIAFLPDGDALVTVWCGEVWRVSGLGGSLDKITWRRFATGFNQPIGVHVDEDGIFVLDRGRITRLHDRNGDGEADYHENYADDFGGYNRSHTHTFGLVRTPDKAFHFVQRESVLRTSPSPKTDLEALGVRNCMGAGLWDGRYYIAPQEGTWTPASAIIEVRPGDYYGHEGDRHRDREIAPPLCYVPRGVDNSTGGMVEVSSEQWGPLAGGFLGLSYGSGIHYLILRDDSGPRAQGATVPLDGEFLAGTMRGAFHPGDGQLYVAGLDGWGDYSLQDGCLHRVRYTGQPVRKPVGFRVHSNGIRIDFSCELEEDSLDPEKFFAQQWNYLYSGQYGSPEYSVKEPGTPGHDRVPIRSVRLLGDRRSIFVEIPELVPCMQMQIRMHLTAADGTAFKTDLFPSILQLGEHFHTEGLAKAVPNKLTAINLPIKRKKNASQDTVSGTPSGGARELLVEVLGGLQFKQKELRARAGEALALKLVNKDVMPHNLVLTAPGRKKEVGEASFKMLNDPKAGEKHYVPDLESVLTFTFVVPPGGSHVTYFQAPAAPGRYPYICTFPGHWQAMQGVLIVE